MASDGKTEKDVSADSTTSVLGEEVCSGFHLFWIVKSFGVFFDFFFYVNGYYFSLPDLSPVSDSRRKTVRRLF